MEKEKIKIHGVKLCKMGRHNIIYIPQWVFTQYPELKPYSILDLDITVVSRYRKRRWRNKHDKKD